VHRNIRAGIPLIIVCCPCGTSFVSAEDVCANYRNQRGTPNHRCVSTPLVLAVVDLKKMPRKTLSVVNPHNKKTETYEGVLLEELLHRAGVPQGEQLRGPAMATYVIAGAEDGYRVVFSLAELDSGILESEVIAADTMDGAPLGAKEGPFRLVAPHEKRPARWVRMLKSIKVVRP
jgi:DMSO/TMAO reductase YedYZ molybdopterin-dependent catalytic subunit